MILNALIITNSEFTRENQWLEDENPFSYLAISDHETKV